MLKRTAIFIFAILLIPAFLSAKSPNPKPPKRFVNIQTIVPDAVMDIRYFTPHNFVGYRIDGYEAPKCILTNKAAKALAGVQNDLKKYGMSIKIYDCYRPQRAVDNFVEWAKDIDDTRMKAEFYPDVDKRVLFKEGYIASKSGHSRGSTLDLTIVELPAKKQPDYRSGQKLYDCRLPAKKRFKDNGIDMGTGFDCFDPLSHTANPKISQKEKKNRLLLKTLMEKHGFQNYDKEWWHYTLKDEPYRNKYFNFVIN